MCFVVISVFFFFNFDRGILRMKFTFKYDYLSCLSVLSLILYSCFVLFCFFLVLFSCLMKSVDQIETWCCKQEFNPLNVNTIEMIKHTQATCRLLPTNCLNVFDHFLGLAFKRLMQYSRCLEICSRKSAVVAVL